MDWKKRRGIKDTHLAFLVFCLLVVALLVGSLAGNKTIGLGGVVALNGLTGVLNLVNNDTYISVMNGLTHITIGLAKTPPLGPTYTLNTTTIAAVKYYYAYNSGSRLIYGGPANLGGATGTSFSSVLNKVMTNGNERVVWQANSNFILDAAVAYAVSGVVWQGGGSSTNVTETAVFNAVPFTISGANWRISDMRFDARNVVTGASSATLKFTGQNDTVANSYFNRGDHGQINLGGVRGTASNNVVSLSTDDGIIISGQRDIVVGNQVFKTTNHNCISLVSSSYSVIEDNSCTGSGTNGIAVENLGAGIAQNIVIARNVIAGTVNAGVVIYQQSTGVDSGRNVTITGNIISKPATNGIAIDSGQQISVTGNTIVGAAGPAIILPNAVVYDTILITGNIITNFATNGVELDGTAPQTVITNNVMEDLLTGGRGILVNGATADCIISGNVVEAAASNTASDGILFTSSASNNCLIGGNSLLGIATKGTAIYIHVAQTGTVVQGNMIDSWAVGIKDDNSADFNVYDSNSVRSSVTTPFSLAGVNDLVANNIGYNPVAPSTYTACASVCTYTNVDGVGESFRILAANGITNLTCEGVAVLIFNTNTLCIIQPRGTMVITWAGAAPTFNKVPFG
jgi:hypothetical protein